ncbi:MAG: family acetyltransferase [Candidatus Angelobacter sp.]|nr:family acetyltransferase [Candidatus Angelobacter sp.]
MTENKFEFRIEPLGKAHDRAAFSCGITALDNYLITQARQDVEKRVSAVFICTPDVRTVAGFYTLSQYSVNVGALPERVARKLPKYPEVPTSLLGRLAVSEQFRGQGLGEHLLIDALYRCLRQSKEIASAAVVVDAKDANAASFYQHYGFIGFPGIADRLFLPMKSIQAMFEGKQSQRR